MTTGGEVHLSEEDLVLLYYDEHPHRASVQIHLASCQGCAAAFEELAGTLAMIDDAPMPARDERYGLEVWQRLRPELPQRPSAFSGWRKLWPSLGVAAAVLMASTAAFVAGRQWSTPAPAIAPESTALRSPVPPGGDDRARLAAVVDHLERSERLLLDVTNGDVTSAIDSQQGWVADLVQVNRLYREAASQAGDSTVAAVLDDLERALLDIVHAPSTLTTEELAVVRTRLDAAALLFKIRVLANELRDREVVPVAPRKTT